LALSSTGTSSTISGTFLNSGRYVGSARSSRSALILRTRNDSGVRWLRRIGVGGAKLGYIAAKPIALVLRTINAFALGARKVNPKAEVHVIFTGDWTLPVREAESVNALAGAGCDVIACHIDSPKVVIENAEARGIKTCGHNTDQARLAPKGFITGAELKYITIYKSYSEKIVNGEKLPNLYEGGFDRDMVQNTAFGAGATDAARTAAMAATAEIKGGAPIFVGPLKDNKGKTVIEKTLGLYEPSLWGMDYLIEGVAGSVT